MITGSCQRGDASFEFAGEPEQLIDFSSGYLQRALPILPRQGSKSPWKLHQSYLADLLQTGLAPLDDGVMQFR